MTNQTVSESQDEIDGKHFVMEMCKCEFKNAATRLGKREYINGDSWKSIDSPMAGFCAA
jgi:hypothetical protein